MADLKDCLDAAVLDDALSKEAAEEFKRHLDEILGEAGEGVGWHERQQRAASRLQAEIERALVRKRRMRVKQAAKQDIITGRLRAAPQGTRDKAALSVLDFDPKLEHVGENVAMRHLSTRGQAFAYMTDFLDKFRSKAGGLTRNVTALPDVVKGLFGEATTKEGKALAEAVMAARKYLVARFNFAGGDIRDKKAWGWVQRHDRALVAGVSQKEWTEFVIPRLDPAKMYDAAGLPMTRRQMIMAVNSAYESITTGDLKELGGEFATQFGSPVNARIAHRELAFRDSTAWLEYQKRFGDPDLFGSIVGEIDKLSRDVALMEVMGPYPRAMLERIKALVDEDRAAFAVAGKGPKARKAADRIGKHKFLDSVFAQVNGTANLPGNSGFATAMQSNRNLLTASRLGSAIWLALGGDTATATLTAKMAGIPQAKLIAQMVKQLSPFNAADRRMAARMGYISEVWTGSQAAAARIMGEVSGLTSTAKIADSALRLSGLSGWTDGGKAAFKLELVGLMTENANKPFAKIEPALLRTLQRYGITEEDWKLYGSTSIWTDPETGAEFIRPEDTWLEVSDMPAGLLQVGEREARFQAAQRLGEMIHAESHFAIVSPTARSRALVVGSTAPGTFLGEAIRNVALWKSFAVTFLYLHGSRGLAQQGAWAKTQYLGWAFIGMTLGGALAEQASSIARGKDPMDMGDPRFWGSAVIRGGAFGPIGDFFFSSVSRHGNNLPEALLGPVLGGQLIKGVRLTLGNLQDFVKSGEMRNAGSEFVRFADMMVPGASLWYARLAWERMVTDQIQAAIDGGDAAKRFRRVERQALQDFDQRFWWRPGALAPERAPEIGK